MILHPCRVLSFLAIGRSGKAPDRCLRESQSLFRLAGEDADDRLLPECLASTIVASNAVREITCVIHPLLPQLVYCSCKCATGAVPKLLHTTESSLALLDMCRLAKYRKLTP